MRQTNQTPISVIGNRVRVERQQAWEYHFDPSAVPRAQIGSADGKAGDFVMRTRYRVGIDGTPSSGKPGKHISDAGHVYLRKLDPVPRWRSLPFTRKSEKNGSPVETPRKYLVYSKNTRQPK